MKSKANLVCVVMVLATCVDWASAKGFYPWVRKCTDGKITCFQTAVADGGGAIFCERASYEIKG